MLQPYNYAAQKCLLELPVTRHLGGPVYEVVKAAAKQ